MARVEFGHRHERESAVPLLKRPQTVGTLPEADKKIAAGFDNINIDGYKRTMGNKGTFLLVRLLKERPRALRKLKIDSHQIGDKGAVALFDHLATDKGLTKLEMGNNNLGPVAMKACYNMLKVNSTLTHLDLYQNKNIGETGGILVGSALRVSNSLKSLCLNQCNIPVKGMLEIADALSNNTSVTLLSASGNSNNPKVAKAMADCLEVNKTLRALTLGGGSINSKKIKNEGIGYICSSLERNTTLTKILVPRNALKDAALVAIGKLLAVNKTLKIIDVSKNKFTDKGYAAAIEGVKVNDTIIGIYMSHTQSSVLFHLQSMLSQNAEKQGIFARTTFEDVLKDSSARGPLNRTKLMLIGQGRAGKSATVRALFSEPFDPDWKSTVGAAVNIAKVNASTGWSKIEGKAKYKFAVDFAAKIALKDMKEFDASVAEASKEAFETNKNAVAVGTDLKGNEDIQAREQNVDESQMKLKHQKSAHFISKDENLTVIEAPVKGYKNFTKQYHNDLYTETEEDEDAMRFTIWDYGGQRIFYSLHHLFMSKLGVYLLIFSMQEIQESLERGQAYLEFWLKSLSLHAPDTPLILVGTFWDALKGEDALREINTVVNGVLERYAFNVVHYEKEDGNLSFYPISNKLGNGMGILRETIDRTARDLDHMGTELPLSWVYVIEHLLSKYKKPYITLDKFKDVAKSFKVKDDIETIEMLKTFSDLGLVLYLTQTNTLRNFIVLKPQWLITNFGRVIRDQNLHKHNQAFIKKNNLEEDVQHMFEDGLVSENFLEFVWKEREVDYLLDMMKQTLMLSDWSFKNCSVSATDKVYYFVPSLVTGSNDIEDYDGNENFDKNMQEKLTYEGFLQAHENIENFAFFRFKFLPDGIFDRLICLCVGHSNLLKVDKPPVISRGMVELSFGVNEVIRVYNEVRFATIVMEVDSTSLERAPQCLLKVQSMLQKLRADITGDGLKWMVNFHTNSYQPKSYDEADVENLAPFFQKHADLKAPQVKDIEHIDVNYFLEGLQEL